MTKKSYIEKLRDPRWQKKRLEILERDDWSCKICKSKEKTLHVHHIEYLYHWEPWEYDEMFLITLCEDCHEQETEYSADQWTFLKMALKHNGWGIDAVEELIKKIWERSEISDG